MSKIESSKKDGKGRPQLSKLKWKRKVRYQIRANSPKLKLKSMWVAHKSTQGKKVYVRTETQKQASLGTTLARDANTI
jgi:hypothetical protein